MLALSNEPKLSPNRAADPTVDLGLVALDFEGWKLTMEGFPAAAFVRVRLAMRSTDEGGRSKPIFSGYRPNCWIGRLTDEAEREYSDAAIWLEAVDTLAPGETPSHECSLLGHRHGRWSRSALASRFVRGTG